jgi:hypothetical protein
MPGTAWASRAITLSTARIVRGRAALVRRSLARRRSVDFIAYDPLVDAD